MFCLYLKGHAGVYWLLPHWCAPEKSLPLTTGPVPAGESKSAGKTCTDTHTQPPVPLYLVSIWVSLNWPTIMCVFLVLFFVCFVFLFCFLGNAFTLFFMWCDHRHTVSLVCQQKTDLCLYCQIFSIKWKNVDNQKKSILAQWASLLNWSKRQFKIIKTRHRDLYLLISTTCVWKKKNNYSKGGTFLNSQYNLQHTNVLQSSVHILCV